MADYLKPDICVIGAGAAGLAAVEEARRLGASVVLIERSGLGGDLNTGSLPSKALAAAAAHAQALRQASRFGMTNSEPKPNFRSLQTQMQAVIDTAMPEVSPERLTALGVHIIAGDAAFIDRRTLRAGDALVRARRYCIATGSTPLIPAIPGLADIEFFTTETIFANARKLTHLLVIGGGPAGVELAQAHRRLGSAVTLVEPGTVLSQSDPELADIVVRQLRDEGMDIRPHTRISQIIARNQGIGVRLDGAHGNDETLDVSHVLVTTGRVANLMGLHLDLARIAPSRTQPGRLQLSGTLRTSNRRIYVIGDAAGTQQQVLAARRQARIAVRHALLGAGAGRAPLAPRALYTDPELAEVGLTEPQARAKFKGNYRLVRVPFAQNERAQVMQRTYGVAKLVCRGDGRIVGAGIAGPQAGELISILTLAIAHGLNAADLAGLPTPYPSLADTVRQLGAAFGQDQPLSLRVRTQVLATRWLS